MNILMLLIGANNIANYALIKYFKENGGIKIPRFDKVALVYTKASISKNGAENIKKLIDDVEYIDILLNNENDIQSIIKDIKKSLEELNIEAIHLNYTGGRKPMSLGAFLAVKEFEENGIKAVYSDISHRDYRLTFFDGERFPKERSLSDNIQLKIDEIFILHGNDKPVYQKEVSEFYSEEFVGFLIDKNIEDIDGKNDFYNIWDSKDYKSKEWQKSVEGYVDRDISNKKLGKLKSFITGGFLEEYIFILLKEMQFELGLSDIGWNVRNGKSAKFEIDIMGVKGYKPFVISCTTEHKKGLVKSKFFEAMYRSEQIGGIKTTPISISFADKDTINKILTEDVANKDDKSKPIFIGIDELRGKELIKDSLKSIVKSI